jgi:hypothetical protein
MKKTMIALMATALLAVGLTVQAQTNVPAPNPVVIVTPAPAPNAFANLNATSIQALLANGIITIGQPSTINGVTGIVNVNSNGVYVITVLGSDVPNGSLTYTPPNTTSSAIAEAEAMLRANNPTNRGYYGTNELVVRLAADYLQNSGQAVVEIGLEKYGLLKSMPQFGIGAALFQGTRAGYSGTAGACGFVDYRKILGDVSLQVGLGGGYDNWNRKFMALVKLDLELRQNTNIGEFVRVAYAYEPGSLSNSSLGGLIIGGGINYSFRDFNVFGLGIGGS